MIDAYLAAAVLLGLSSTACLAGGGPIRSLGLVIVCYGLREGRDALRANR